MAKFDLIISGNTSEIANSVVGESVLKGDILYLNTDSKWYKASATSILTSTTELGIASIDAITNAEINIISTGHFNYTPGSLSSGLKYYLSTVPGKITTTLYVNTANVIRYLGTAYSDEILVFNPDQTYISDNGVKVNGVPLKTPFIDHTHTEDDISDLDKYTTQEINNMFLQHNTFLFSQSTPQSVWSITHTLNKYPSVTVIDSAGTQVEGTVTFIDTNTLIISFNAAFSGTATLN